MPIDELLDILRQVANPRAAWDVQLKLLQRKFPSALWAELPGVDISHDADAAATWLQGALERMTMPVGVYLGLDTLNMDNGTGHNLELGWSFGVNVDSDDIEWLDEDLEYGPRHLIDGLVRMHSTYSLPKWKQQFANADYMLFLGYSGLVLREAVRKAAIPVPALVAWGFHDGDMFLLGRKDDSGFAFLGC